MGRPKIQIPKDQLIRFYFDQKLPPTKIAERFNCHPRTIINHLRYYHLPVRSRSEGTALAKVKYPRHSFSGDLKEKAYLIGFRIGDLTVDRTNQNGITIRISCASTKDDQIDLIASLFSSYGRVLINGPYENGRRFIQCLVDETFTFMLPKHTAIPEWILERDETMSSFVGGYIDAEGHFGISRGKGSFRLASADQEILWMIYQWIAGNGIQCPAPRLWLKRGYRNQKTGVGINKDIWRLGVYRKLSLAKLTTSLIPMMRHAKRVADAKIILDFLKDR